VAFCTTFCLRVNFGGQLFILMERKKAWGWYIEDTSTMNEDRDWEICRGTYVYVHGMITGNAKY
jgi:hypothetical protein